MSAIACMLLHSQAIVREGVRSLLQQADLVRVFTDCQSSREALAVLEKSSVQIMLVELGGDGLVLVRAVKARFPELSVVTMATGKPGVNQLVAAIESGISGHVSLDDREDIIRGLKVVLAGGSYLSPGLGLGVLQQLLHTVQSHPLTEREQEILAELQSGRPLAEVARHLCLSTSTVKSHLNRIYRKIGVSSRVAATRYAADVGLVPLAGSKSRALRG